VPSRLIQSQSDRQSDPGFAAPAPPDPDPDRPTPAAEAELVAAVRGWLDTGMPTAADVEAWSWAFRALEASEWRDDTRWALGPAPTAEGGDT